MGLVIQNPFEEELKGFQKLSYDEETNTTIVVNRTTRKQCIIKKLVFNELDGYEKYLKIYKKRQLFKSKSVQKLIKHSTIVSESLCSTIYQLYGLWEYHDNTLRHQIEKRVRSSKQFTQKQMQSIVRNLVYGFQELQQNNIVHEKISVYTIKMNDDCEIKISDPLSLDNNSNFSKIYSRYSSDRLYLSPEECSALEMESFCVKSSKNDVWTCGIIILEIGLLENQNLCYRANSRKINWVKLNENIYHFGKIYSQQLRIIVQAMLTRNKKDRPNWEQLMRKIQQIFVVNQIKSMGQCIINNNRLSPQIITYQTLPQINCSSRLSQEPLANLKGAKVPVSTILQNKQNLGQLSQLHIQIQEPILAQMKQGEQLPVSPHSPQFVSSISGSKVIGYGQLKRFSTSSSKIGYLFTSDPNTQCKHLPVTHIQTLQNRLQMHPILSQLSNPQIKNAESITFDAELNNIQFNQFNKQLPNKVILKEEKEIEIQEIISEHEKQLQKPNAIDNKSEFVGSRYEGYMLKNMRHGHGKFYYQDGGLYDGQWVYNKMNGKGMLYYQSGALAYDGYWKNDQFDGKGKFYNETPQPLNSQFDYHDFNYVGEYWKYYEGEFSADMKHGLGKLMLTNDEYFIGNFDQDIVDGYGKFYGRMVIADGIWKNNRLIKIE